MHAVFEVAQIDPHRFGPGAQGLHFIRATVDSNLQRIEITVVDLVEVVRGAECSIQTSCSAVDALGNLTQSLWTVVHRVHRGHHREQ